MLPLHKVHRALPISPRQSLLRHALRRSPIRSDFKELRGRVIAQPHHGSNRSIDKETQEEIEQVNKEIKEIEKQEKKAEEPKKEEQKEEKKEDNAFKDMSETKVSEHDQKSEISDKPPKKENPKVDISNMFNFGKK